MDRIPKVSIIIPVYNGSNYLREAIDSALAQTYSSCEIIVVDDGSTDTTWDIIQFYGNQIRGFHKPNGGVASALNFGIQHMQGEYFAWLSHDDLWLPDKIQKQVDFLRLNPNCKICYTDYFIIDSSCNILKTINTPWYPRQKAIQKLFKSGYIHGSTIMVKKICFDKVGLFSEQLKYTQDTEMWIRLSRVYELGRVPEKLIMGRWHSQQGSKNIFEHRSEIVLMSERTFLSFDIDELFPECQMILEIPRKKAMAYTWFANVMSQNQHEFEIAEKYYKKSIEMDPSWQNNARLYFIKNRIQPIMDYLLKKLKPLKKNMFSYRE